MLNNDKLLRDMGQRGRKFIFENCDWANIVTKLEEIYEEAIKYYIHFDTSESIVRLL